MLEVLGIPVEEVDRDKLRKLIEIEGLEDQSDLPSARERRPRK